jgi:hypothetical protein
MGFYSATIEGIWHSQVVNNVLGIRGPGDVPGGVQADDVARRVRNAWQSSLMPLLSSGYVLTGVNVVSATNPEVGGFISATGGGPDNTEGVTGLVAAGVQIRTGLRGRAFRGRTGIPGLTEPMVAGNFLTAAARNNLQGGMDAFRGALGGPTAPDTEVYELGVISRFKGVDANGVPIPRVGGPIFTPSISVDVSSRISSRVSRLR